MRRTALTGATAVSLLALAAPATAAPGDLFAILYRHDLSGGAHQVIKIDARSGAGRTIGSLRRGDEPHALAVTSSGRVLVSLNRQSGAKLETVELARGGLRVRRLEPRWLNGGPLQTGPGNALYTVAGTRRSPGTPAIWRISPRSGRGRVVDARLPARAGGVLVDQLSGRLFFASASSGSELGPVYGKSRLFRRSGDGWRFVEGSVWTNTGIGAVRGGRYYGGGSARTGDRVISGSVAGGGRRELVRVAAAGIDDLAAGRRGVFAVVNYSPDDPESEEWGPSVVARVDGGALAEVFRYPAGQPYHLTQVAVQPQR